jgi:hypothetical protein
MLFKEILKILKILTFYYVYRHEKFNTKIKYYFEMK